jgi:serine/threonine protein kinase
MINQLGRYEIVGELGQGAMGVVYSAKDPLIGRTVAIKTINLGLMREDKAEYEGRFYQEAKAAGCLSHPNIVTIYDVGKSDDVAYIAMEFLEGRELRDILNDGQRLSVDQALDIVIQVALGLDYAHEHGIIHRDVKPSNIMVIRDGHVKITDFGIARMASSTVRTQTGMVLGSPKYMSPEQVMGQSIDLRSDIFSLGVLLYELLTGKTPFNGENISAIMYQTVNTVPPAPSTLNPGVNEMLDLIIAKAMAKELDDRYQNAKELANDLRVCRGTLQRGSAAQALSAPQPRLKPIAKLADEAAAAGNFAEEASRPVVKGLSQAFDSTGATMRLATMTGTDEIAADFSRTFKMEKHNAGAANRPDPAAKAASRAAGNAASRPAAANAAADAPKAPATVPANAGKWLLVMILIVVLVGVIQLIESLLS